MKTKLNLLLIAAALVTTAHAVLPGNMPVMLEHLKRTQTVANAEKALAEYESQWTSILGEGWHARLLASTLPESEEMAAVYLTGKRFDYPWASGTTKAKNDLADYIVAKETLDADDLKIINAVGPYVVPKLQPRMADILALLDPKTFEYYKVKYGAILVGSQNDSTWAKQVTPNDWLTLVSGKLNAAQYTLVRDNLLLTFTNAMIEKRAGLNQDTDGPEFDTAMAPIIAALSAPLFDGLAAATQTLGLDVKLADYSQTAIDGTRLANSIERRTISENEAKAGMGTIMFVKGVTAYNAWAEALKKPQP